MAGELIDQFTGHEDRVSRFVEQFKNKPDLAALARSYLKQLQDLENALFEVILERNLDVAVGVQLTTNGNIVGQPRTTPNDNRFRTAIRARIAINLSDGTGEDLIRVADLLLFDGESYQLREEPPAQIRVTILDSLTSADADLVRDLLDAADPGGVRLLLQFNASITTKLLLSDHPSGAVFGGGLGDAGAAFTGGEIDSVFGPE